MDEHYRQGLLKNLVIFHFFQIFSKRVYLPLIAVFAVSVAHLSLEQFGVILSLGMLTLLVLEVPSGYVSDKMGHKRALILGTGLMALGPLGFVFFQNFWGVLLEAVLYTGGFAFLSGTREAFIHETLMELDREHEYGRMAGRFQTAGLLGNVVLLSLIPLTYVFDPRLPFLLGSIVLSGNFWMSFAFTVPKRSKKTAAELDEISFTSLARALRVNRQWLLFFILGMTGGASITIPHFREIYLQTLNVPVSWFGFIVAGASLVAAGASYNLHRMERFRAEAYYALSFTTLFLATLIAGLFSVAWLGILVMVLILSYNRNEHLLTKSFLLRECPTQELKATYLSLFSFMESLHSAWMSVVLGFLAGALGVRPAHAWFGGGMLILMITLFSFYLWRKYRIPSLSRVRNK